MSRIDNQRITSYLLQHGVSLPMIAGLEVQRIKEEDLQTMDRDDIEHLFKNEYGFTFADRKRFWTTIQKLRLATKKADVVYIEQQDQMPDIYEIIDDPPANYQLVSPQYASLSTQSSSGSKITPPAPRYNDLSRDTSRDVLDKTSSNDPANTLRRETTLLPAPEDRQPQASDNFEFKYPVQLPVFSAKVTQALQNNIIKNEWRTLIKELVQWILSKTLEGPKKSEYQAIGFTLFKQYPSIGTDGFRPWSYLCRCIAESLRKERRKLGLSRVRKIN